MKIVARSHLSPCPISLINDHIKQFYKNGYLTFSHVITDREVEQACLALSQLTKELATDPNSEYSPPSVRANGNHTGASYKCRSSRFFMQFESGFDPEGLPPEEIEFKVRKYMWFTNEDPVFQKMVSFGSRLYSIVQALLGPNPIVFQEMALVKPSFIGSEKPWHQDNAYFSVVPLDAIIGVWIALDDATLDNGCMHVIPGGHKDGAFQHHHGTDCEIDSALLPVKEAIPLPLPAGGGMFFCGMLPHKTPENYSSQRRRALQFHFRGAKTRYLDDQEYDQIFVNKNHEPASCRNATKSVADQKLLT